jgi:hypothetical protein
LIGRNKQGADLPRHEQLGHESWGFIMTIMIIIVTIITISLEETQDLINHQSSIINQQSTINKSECIRRREQQRKIETTNSLDHNIIIAVYPSLTSQQIDT